MKRITGITIAIAAFIGCSYVGGASAQSCEAIADNAAITLSHAATYPGADVAASVGANGHYSRLGTPSAVNVMTLCYVVGGL